MNRSYLNKSRYAKKTSSSSSSNPPSPPFILTKEYCEMILSKGAYIGQQGFTILKSEIHPEDLIQIKQQLTVQPLQSFSGPGKMDIISFPVFRENDKKIYIPRFYGESRYGGFPIRNELSIGDKINVPFVKPIRDYQENIIQVYLNHIQKKQSSDKEGGGGGILEVPCGRGKCLGKDTPILMYDGSIKLVQDIIVGDILMGDDSTPRNVLSLARGRETMYKIRENVFEGEEYIVNESHILSLVEESSGKIIDISVMDYLILPKHLQDTLSGYRVQIHFQEKKIEEEEKPYMIGYNSLNNNIPIYYKCNCQKIQLELLTGIIDAIGIIHLPPNLIKIKKNKNTQQKIKDILFLSRSLGFKTYQTKSNIFISLQVQNENKYDFVVEKLEIDDYYGFEIDGNRRFVLGDFTVTHNTVMALKIISEIERKTLYDWI